MLGLPQPDGHSSTRAFFLFSDVFTRQVGISARVSIARGFSYLPCKRSARDNSSTRDNFPP